MKNQSGNPWKKIFGLKRSPSKTLIGFFIDFIDGKIKISNLGADAYYSKVPSMLFRGITVVSRNFSLRREFFGQNFNGNMQCR